MAQRVYKVERGGLHERFQASRAKIQIFGGGFGNGKTTGAVVKALQIARNYPGANILVARSTYPKLNATIRKEVAAWCPPGWIKRDVNSKDNLIELENGSIINFSYIAQTGKSQESSTSNLLSATYDLIVVDQVEDPEITHKDFLDLLGRLRGQTTYQGDDETMPTTGPRWMILMCNPTRNWVYRELVKPVQDWKLGLKNEKLLWDEENNCPMIEIFEGPTYENAANLPADFIKTQEAAYKGQMRKRFLLGEWGAYEGLVYPQYNPMLHLVEHKLMVEHYESLVQDGFAPSIIEAYDHGIAQYACYGFAFTDLEGNIFLMDGYYEKEKRITELAQGIKQVRRKYGYDPTDEFFENADNTMHMVQADPSIFKRVSGNSKTVGVSVAGLFREEGVLMTRGNNDITSGIAKVQSYLAVDRHRRHPITGNIGSPRLFVSTQCDWFDKEIVDYYWKKDTSGETEDTPMDRNDHAMDMTKYLLTDRPRVAIVTNRIQPPTREWTSWGEIDVQAFDAARRHRYG